MSIEVVSLRPCWVELLRSARLFEVRVPRSRDSATSLDERAGSRPPAATGRPLPSPAMASIKSGHWHKHPGVRSGRELTFGERAADVMRNGMGSWIFVGAFFGVMILWAGVNTFYLSRVVNGNEFDPFPYILLNLFLSMLAGVQAAALLIAAKRQDAISSELAVHDDQLLTENTRVTNEIHSLTQRAAANTQLIHLLCEKAGIDKATVDQVLADAGLPIQHM